MADGNNSYWSQHLSSKEKAQVDEAFDTDAIARELHTAGVYCGECREKWNGCLKCEHLCQDIALKLLRSGIVVPSRAVRELADQHIAKGNNLKLYGLKDMNLAGNAYIGSGERFAKLTEQYKEK